MKIYKKNKKILIAPLDWGLGHATRCIPLIQLFLNQKIEVIVCCNPILSSLLKAEFPDITVLDLKGYNIKYSKEKRWFLMKIIAQLPKLFKAVNFERRWLSKVIETHQIDGVISDNRLGFYSKKKPSVFITHQLQIKTGNGFIDKVIQKVNYHFINHFDECWVPDMASSPNFAGELSHPKLLPKIPVKYLGLVSRFKKNALPKKYSLAIVLSGPEPQRSIFENIIINQLKYFSEPVVLIRGLPSDDELLKLPFLNVTQFNHLNADSLNEVLQQSEMVIARSGYSTVMDLIKIQQKAILIPTPGQTEQEYLSEYLHKNQLFYSVQQNNFILKECLQKASEFVFQKINTADLNEDVLTEWLKKI